MIDEVARAWADTERSALEENNRHLRAALVMAEEEVEHLKLERDELRRELANVPVTNIEPAPFTGPAQCD